MEDILDEIPVIKKKETFTLISLICSSTLLLVFAYFMITFPGTVKASETLVKPSIVFVRISQVITAISIISIIISYLRQEPLTKKKKISTVLNLVIVTFIIVVNFVLN